MKAQQSQEGEINVKRVPAFLMGAMTLLAACTTGPSTEETTPTSDATETPRDEAVLLVGSCWEGGGIFKFGADSGEFLEKFADSGELTCAEGDGIVGPDGMLYVTNWNPGRIDEYPDSRDSILRYDVSTGEFVDVFIQPSEQLKGPHGLAFGPDGHLYVATRFGDNVLRYDGETGEFIDEFVASGSGGLNDADRIVFHSDGRMYVVSLETASILRYDARTGEFVDEFVKSGSGGLSRPHDLIFAPDGDLLVSSFPVNAVLRYDGTTGEFEGEFIGPDDGPLEYIGKMTYGPDGMLYLTSCINNMVLRYEAETGEFQGALVEAGAGGLSGTTFMIFI